MHFLKYTQHVFLLGWGVPKDLAERFDQYENQANSNREELKEMAQQLAALRSENSTLQRYFADRLVAMYENLARRDVGITEALRVMLTFNSREQAQSAHFRDEIVRLEALLRQPAADDAPLPTLQPHRLPSLPLAAELDPPADGPATPTDMPPPIEAPQKRAMTPDPDDSGGPPKRQKS